MSRRENFWKGERQMHNSNEMGHKCPCQQVKVYMSQKHYEMWGNFPHKLTSLCISIWFWGGSRGVLISIRWAMMNYSLATRNLVSWKYNSCFKTYWFNKFYSKKKLLSLLLFGCHDVWYRSHWQDLFQEWYWVFIWGK